MCIIVFFFPHTRCILGKEKVSGLPLFKQNTLLISAVDTQWKENHFYLLSPTNVSLRKFQEHQWEVIKVSFHFLSFEEFWCKVNTVPSLAGFCTQCGCAGRRATVQRGYSEPARPHQLPQAPACIVEYIFMMKYLTEKVQLVVNFIDLKVISVKNYYLLILFLWLWSFYCLFTLWWHFCG